MSNLLERTKTALQDRRKIVTKHSAERYLVKKLKIVPSEISIPTGGVSVTTPLTSTNITKRWYLNAANQGDPNSQCSLGVLYDIDKVRQNYSKARGWYLKAAYQGHVAAMYSIGIMYEYNKGVLLDYSKAMEWYQKAADQGHGVAQSHLGAMYVNGKAFHRTIPRPWSGI